VLYKPSEYSTLTGLHIRRLLYRSGVPEKCFPGNSREGKWRGSGYYSCLWDGYFFTGSYRTGGISRKKRPPKLVPCQLELGGRTRCMMMDDVEDIDKTAAAALEGSGI